MESLVFKNDPGLKFKIGIIKPIQIYKRALSYGTRLQTCKYFRYNV